MTWLEHEARCLLFLQNTYGHLGVVFEPLGGHNANETDIKVTLPNSTSFYVEVKMPESQSGQFVVLDKNNSFIFSEQNHDHKNTLSKTIVDYMNSNYSQFVNPSTKGKNLQLPQKMLDDWVISHYKNKNVRFLITENKYGLFVISSISELGQNYSVSATYRVKGSGSSNPSIKNLTEIKNIVGDNLLNIVRDKKKTTAIIANYPEKSKLAGTKYSYQFMRQTGNIYGVRQLSNTRNANVIFTVNLKPDQSNDGVKLFEASLQI